MSSGHSHTHTCAERLGLFRLQNLLIMWLLTSCSSSCTLPSTSHNLIWSPKSEFHTAKLDTDFTVKEPEDVGDKVSEFLMTSWSC
jgi:hypothetical protein